MWLDVTGDCWSADDIDFPRVKSLAQRAPFYILIFGGQLKEQALPYSQRN